MTANQARSYRGSVGDDGGANVRELHWMPRKPSRPGRIVAHNHVRPVDFHALFPPNVDGFRVWTDDASDRYVRCECEWAGERLAEHYRVRPELIDTEPAPLPPTTTGGARSYRARSRRLVELHSA